MTVDLPALHGIDNTIDGDLAAHQIGKGGSAAEFEVGNMSRVKAERRETVIGKVRVDLLRIDIVDVASLCDFRRVTRILRRYRRRLAYTEGIGKDPCRHGQGCQNPAHFQLFGFGMRLFAAPFIAVISVCHRKYLLSVCPFSICSSF